MPFLIGLRGIYIAALTCQDMADQGRFLFSRDNERSQYDGRSELHHDRRCSLPRRPPGRLRFCQFWKNRRRGCILGRENCYYLAQVVITEENGSVRAAGTQWVPPASVPAAIRTWNGTCGSSVRQRLQGGRTVMGKENGRHPPSGETDPEKRAADQKGQAAGLLRQL